MIAQLHHLRCQRWAFWIFWLVWFEVLLYLEQAGLPSGSCAQKFCSTFGKSFTSYSHNPFFCKNTYVRKKRDSSLHRKKTDTTLRQTQVKNTATSDFFPSFISSKETVLPETDNLEKALESNSSSPPVSVFCSFYPKYKNLQKMRSASAGSLATEPPVLVQADV